MYTPLQITALIMRILCFNGKINSIVDFRPVNRLKNHSIYDKVKFQMFPYVYENTRCTLDKSKTLVQVV